MKRRRQGNASAKRLYHNSTAALMAFILLLVIVLPSKVPAQPPPPTVSSLDPSSGPPSGGTTVTITGTGFADSATVKFGDSPAAATIDSDTQITATSPPSGTPGAVNVVVTNPPASSSIPGPESKFTYGVIISAVNPSSGSRNGGTQVQISGGGFTSTSPLAVKFGGTQAAIVASADTQITVLTPAKPVGAVDVEVSNGNGVATRPAGFTYQSGPAPTISSVSPNTGPSAGGTAVTIAGTNIGYPAALASCLSNSVPSASGTCVWFGTGKPTSVTMNSPGQLQATSPPGTTGAATLKVLNSDDQSVSSTFTYTVLSVTSTFPVSGPTFGGQLLTVNGEGFSVTPPPVVKLGTVTAPLVLPISSRQVKVITPVRAPVTSANPPTRVDVTVVNPDTSGTLTAGYTYPVSVTPTILSIYRGSPGMPASCPTNG